MNTTKTLTKEAEKVKLGESSNVLKEIGKNLMKADTNLKTDEQVKENKKQAARKKAKENRELVEAAKKAERTLDEKEVMLLGELEITIGAGLGAAYETAKALRTIREEKLYRQDYKTFDIYVDEKWNMSRSYVSLLVGFADTVDKLSTFFPDYDFNSLKEGQIRPFLACHLTEEKLKEVFEKAVEIANKENKDKLTGKIVKRAIENVTAVKASKSGKADVGSGIESEGDIDDEGENENEEDAGEDTEPEEVNVIAEVKETIKDLRNLIKEEKKNISKKEGIRIVAIFTQAAKDIEKLLEVGK